MPSAVSNQSVTRETSRLGTRALSGARAPSAGPMSLGEAVKTHYHGSTLGPSEGPSPAPGATHMPILLFCRSDNAILIYDANFSVNWRGTREPRSFSGVVAHQYAPVTHVTHVTHASVCMSNRGPVCARQHLGHERIGPEH